MPLGIRPHQVVSHHLTKDRRPAPSIDFLPYAKGRQAVVTALAHLVGLGAHQNVGQMPGAETFPRAQNGGKRLAHSLGPVEQVGRRLA